MTGSLLAPLPLSSPSPVRPVVPSYSVDSFSEFSTRTVNRASYSPTSASGPRSARAKEEDEELYRDLLSGENGAEANDKAPVGYKASTFIPQKPGTRRAPSSTENSNPRQHLVPVKPASPKSKLSTPFIPRLKLEELVKARPDDCDEDDNNNDSQRTSQRGSELKQVTEEDESCFDDRPSEDSGDKMDPRKAHVVPRNRGFNSSLGFTNNSQRSNNNDKLDQETLRFLEKLDLKAVLHTPRPDILSFYPGMAMAPTARSMASPHSKAPACSAKLTEDVYVENRPELEKGGAKQKNDVVFDEPLKVSRVGGVASRLAHMKSTTLTKDEVFKLLVGSSLCFWAIQPILSVEESEEHDCSTAPPSPTKIMFLKTAAKASSFIGAVLDNSPAKTIVEANASNDKLVQTPASRLDRASSVPESADKQKDVAELQRSVSVSETRAPLLPSVTFPPPAVKLPTVNQPRRWTAGSSVHNALLQCNVRNVRITPDHVAVYALATRVPSLTTAEITIERRFREFYVFAQHVCAMFPSSGLWNLFPPKTYCALRHQSTLTDGFLHRRKNGLEEFLHCALEKMVLGGEAQGTIAQWYLLRLFLNLQPGLAAAAPSKDRSLTAALYEFKRHARQYSGWMVNRKPGPCDTVFEKLADGFHMIKRVTTCHFPARAVFDMVTNRSVDNEMPGVSWAPFVESEEVFSRESEHTWTVRTAFKDSSWGRGKLQMISRKTWRVDESGTIAIVMIPADSAAWDDPRALGPNHGSRVDCILGGWLITPTPWEGSCSVTWLMQVNFGVCDPRAEFTGNQGRLASFLDRRCLHVWADEIVHLIQALERVYDPEHYRNHGALIVGPKTLS
ncbi:hypothetical protein PC118_g11695 [Phytophthora cactorum]|uniref:PX domain-containing protein n=1 Tax=Phytophthora cactorum TaxID=29920 RepID=A0A8T1FPA0_9STRA|nr:hypothetical protein PC118_g11695 [Phytophthora cactorum]